MIHCKEHEKKYIKPTFDTLRESATGTDGRIIKRHFRELGLYLSMFIFCVLYAE